MEAPQRRSLQSELHTLERSLLLSALRVAQRPPLTLSLQRWTQKNNRRLHLRLRHTLFTLVTQNSLTFAFPNPDL